MKSIMQEASSIAKAIEKGWEKAGRPAEFSVKIYEEPQKNFIGMTTKPAKIGIFFDEVKHKKSEPKQIVEPRRSVERKEHVEKPQVRKPQQTRDVRQENRTPSIKADKTETQSLPVQERKIERRQPRVNAVEWSEDMIQITRDWIEKSLGILGKNNIQCDITPDQNLLKINFNQSILDDSSKDKLLFRSFAFLLMQLLRSKARKRLRGLKIVLTTSA